MFCIIRQIVSKVYIIDGNAAAFYVQVGHIIQLITSVQHLANNDPDIGDLLTVFFLPN